MKYLLLGVVLLAGCGPKVENVTAKQLYADPVNMNGKTVRIRATIVGEGWLSEHYDIDRGYMMIPPSKSNAVAVLPAPFMANGTIVEAEGKYDGETDVLHVTSCVPVGAQPRP